MPAEVRYSILAQLIDFIYIGEIKLAAEDVDSFIALAKHLKIRGLAEIKQKHQIENVPVVFQNSWTSDNPSEDLKEDIQIEKTPLQELNSEDRLVHQDETKEIENISSVVQEGHFEIDSNFYSASNGLRQIKFQCHHCRRIFGEKAAFVKHIIRAHKPVSGLNFLNLFVISNLQSW